MSAPNTQSASDQDLKALNEAVQKGDFRTAVQLVTLASCQASGIVDEDRLAGLLSCITLLHDWDFHQFSADDLRFLQVIIVAALAVRPGALFDELRPQRAAARRLRHERLVQRADEIISAAQSAALQSFGEGLPDVSGCDGTSPGTPAQSSPEPPPTCPDSL
jgi:hypothetical protein